MVSQPSEWAFADVGEVIAVNLHRLRTARRLSLAALAARAEAEHESELAASQAAPDTAEPAPEAAAVASSAEPGSGPAEES